MGWLVTWIAVLMVAALGVVASANGLRFRRKVASEVREMWTPSSNSVRVDRSRITTLPHPVHRYLLKSIGSRDLGVRTVRLRHGGVFRTKLDGPWLRIRGEQYFNAGPPAFIWWGRIRIAPGVWVDARDRWIAGAGNMRVSLESTLTLADAKGPEIDQGAMLRLLAEMVWFPSILADGRYVSWTAMDGRHVQAKLRVSGREVAAVFEFGEDELPATISADR